MPQQLAADVFDGSWPSVPDRGALRSSRQTTVHGFDPSPLALPKHQAVRFTGFLNVPRDGTYTF